MKVTPPINTPAKEAIEWKESRCSSIIYDPNDVVTAAKPTSEWKRATVYGNSVTATYFPSAVPRPPPTAIKVKA